ncbi:GH20235 [Drosophila grimshawi]|uniref:GH20235 n=1 Tax=Drosophila grimshawi TaxID=7222 RepID=B4J5Q0_DROGR|nr:GH20235 [Drosophila grimshawi]
MQLNPSKLMPLLLPLLLLLGVAFSEASRRQGPIFDTRPSPFNPNPPRGGPYV